MSVVPVRELLPGASVQHVLLVEERAERKAKNGDPFWVITLRDHTGAIKTAPVWFNQASWVDGVQKGAVVQAIGTVDRYNNDRQVVLAAPLHVLPASEVPVERFLPSVAESQREKLWARLDQMVAELAHPGLRGAVELFFRDDAFRVRFERTPGAVRGHHAKVGGLLRHVWEVAYIGKAMATAMRANADLVVAGALLHDIGKTETYTVDARGFDYDPRNALIGHVVLGALLFTSRVEAARAAGTLALSDAQLVELQHLILSHHGSLEFGSPVQPASAEAELLHWADETSAKGDAMNEALEDADLFPEGGAVSSKRSWQLDRKVWRRPAGLWAAENTPT